MSLFGPSKIERAVSVLRSGGLIAYPTDTLYGLGADIANKEAVNQIYLAKERDYNKPLSIAVADFDSIYKLTNVSDEQKQILEQLLPGPYTFLLDSKRIVLDIITNGSDKLGVRYPDHKLALEIISKFGHPITCTSANLSGNQAAKDYHQIDIKPDYVVKGKCKHGQGSTIIDLTNNKIVRKGAGFDRVVNLFN